MTAARTHADSLGFLVSDVTRLMRRAFKTRLEGSLLTFAQARALVYVARNEGIRQVDLADLLEVQPITLARLIDHLCEVALVERRADPVDRRVYRIHLAPAARPQLDAIDEVVVAIRREATRGLSKEETAALSSALIRMRDNLTVREP